MPKLLTMMMNKNMWLMLLMMILLIVPLCSAKDVPLRKPTSSPFSNLRLEVKKSIKYGEFVNFLVDYPFVNMTESYEVICADEHGRKSLGVTPLYKTGELNGQLVVYSFDISITYSNYRYIDSDAFLTFYLAQRALDGKEEVLIILAETEDPVLLKFENSIAPYEKNFPAPRKLFTPIGIFSMKRHHYWIAKNRRTDATVWIKSPIEGYRDIRREYDIAQTLKKFHSERCHIHFFEMADEVNFKYLVYQPKETSVNSVLHEQRAKIHSLSPRTFKLIARQTLQAIAEAHQAGVRVNSITPESFFVNFESGVPRVWLSGLEYACLMTEERCPSSPDARYKHPLLALADLGMGEVKGLQFDIYSYGMFLIELVTRGSIFHNRNDAGIFQKVLGKFPKQRAKQRGAIDDPNALLFFIELNENMASERSELSDLFNFDSFFNQWDLELFYDLLLRIIQWIPRDIPDAEKLLKHPYLSRQSYVIPPTIGLDEIDIESFDVDDAFKIDPLRAEENGLARFYKRAKYSSGNTSLNNEYQILLKLSNNTVWGTTKPIGHPGRSLFFNYPVQYWSFWWCSEFRNVGMSLKEAIGRKYFSKPEINRVETVYVIKRIIRETLLGIRDAHNHGILLNSISPRNIRYMTDDENASNIIELMGLENAIDSKATKTLREIPFKAYTYDHPASFLRGHSSFGYDLYCFARTILDFLSGYQVSAYLKRFETRKVARMTYLLGHMPQGLYLDTIRNNREFIKDVNEESHNYDLIVMRKIFNSATDIPHAEKQRLLDNFNKSPKENKTWMPMNEMEQYLFNSKNDRSGVFELIDKDLVEYHGFLQFKDLILKCLKWDLNEIPSANKLLEHPYFGDLRM